MHSKMCWPHETHWPVGLDTSTEPKGDLEETALEETALRGLSLSLHRREKGLPDGLPPSVGPKDALNLRMKGTS